MYRVKFDALTQILNLTLFFSRGSGHFQHILFVHTLFLFSHSGNIIMSGAHLQ